MCTHACVYQCHVFQSLVDKIAQILISKSFLTILAIRYVRARDCLDSLTVDFNKLPLDTLLPLVVKVFEINYFQYDFSTTKTSERRLSFHRALVLIPLIMPSSHQYIHVRVSKEIFT